MKIDWGKDLYRKIGPEISVFVHEKTMGGRSVDTELARFRSQSPLECKLMRLYQLKYGTARKVVAQNRAALKMGKHDTWSRDLEIACLHTLKDEYGVEVQWPQYYTPVKSTKVNVTTKTGFYPAPKMKKGQMVWVAKESDIPDPSAQCQEFDDYTPTALGASFDTAETADDSDKEEPREPDARCQEFDGTSKRSSFESKPSSKKKTGGKGGADGEPSETESSEGSYDFNSAKRKNSGKVTVQGRSVQASTRAGWCGCRPTDPAQMVV